MPARIWVQGPWGAEKKSIIMKARTHTQKNGHNKKRIISNTVNLEKCNIEKLRKSGTQNERFLGEAPPRAQTASSSISCGGGRPPRTSHGVRRLLGPQKEKAGGPVTNPR